MAKKVRTEDLEEGDISTEAGAKSYTAQQITQGAHRFFACAIPSDVLAKCCKVDTRGDDPVSGFQRQLDPKRAKEIADYIDTGFGTIPCSIVISAQPEAQLSYNSRSKVLTFSEIPGAFLILDGQHRVFGFQLAKQVIRVPVAIYNSLSRSDEARLFIDINTKQKPVPNELLLDIKKMAETESDTEALLHEVFDQFSTSSGSVLLGLMSASERQKGKISRVKFNAALRRIWPVIGNNTADFIYSALNEYLKVWLPVLRKSNADITNATLFRAIVMLFPLIAERVSDRHGEEFSAERFSEILVPFLSRVRKQELREPGGSHSALFDSFKKALHAGFSIGRGRGN